MISSNHQPHKFISSLDLNFLDIKFKSLKRETLEVPNSPKMSRNFTLPFLKDPKQRNDTTIDASSLLLASMHNNSSIPDNVDLYEYIQSIEKVKNSEKKNFQNKQQLKIPKEVKRYKKMIHKMKKQNDFLHKHISKLYYDPNTNSKFDYSNGESAISSATGTKGVKNIKGLRLLSESNEKPEESSSLSKNSTKKLPHFSSTGTTKRGQKEIQLDKYDKLYENLYDDVKCENKRGELQNLKKKIMNNNLDKSLQAYFTQKKMRIPEFIRKLR